MWNGSFTSGVHGLAWCRCDFSAEPYIREFFDYVIRTRWRIRTGYRKLLKQVSRTKGPCPYAFVKISIADELIFKSLTSYNSNSEKYIVNFISTKIAKSANIKFEMIDQDDWSISNDLLLDRELTIEKLMDGDDDIDLVNFIYNLYTNKFNDISSF